MTRQLRTTDGDFIDLAELHLASPDELARLRVLGELLGVALQRGYRTGWAAHAYRRRFGEWPPRSWASAPALQPGDATLRSLGLEDDR